MKKFIKILFMVVLCLPIVACSNNNIKNNNSDISSGYQEQDTNKDDNENMSNSSEDTTSEIVNNKGKTLVVYFSCTGNTKKVAENMAEGLNADIHEILPEVSYTSDDLDYNNDNSRSSKEMNDKSSRPVISGRVENMEQYDNVFIGYPIWWSEAPRILDTFVESYDFTGKTVIPFCTSGSSDIASSSKALQELAGSGTWLEGRRFSGKESKDEIMEWVNSLSINNNSER